MSPSTVINFGTIEGGSRYGVTAESVTNGSAADVTALIEGRTGVNAVTIVNFGTILGSGAYQTSAAGVSMYLGAVTNGSATDVTALIEGGSAGVKMRGAQLTATIDNFGTIKGGDSSYAGVFSNGAVTVTNGSAADVTALIEGLMGVESRKLATIVNFGTIRGSQNDQRGTGVYMTGGAVTNGSATGVAALIEGYTGIFSRDAHARISNFGTIEANHRVGIFLDHGGTVTNGSAADTTALIEGARGGLFAHGGRSTRIANFGTIQSLGKASAYGVALHHAASLTNGAAGDAGALISGRTGVIVRAGGVTITNFGTIAGTQGTAVRLVAGDELRVEAGAVFEGAVLGGGAVLALASGRGTIDALAGGDVTVSGRGRTTTYSDFGTLELTRGSRFTLTGSGVIACGGTATLIDNGRLIVTGALA